MSDPRYAPFRNVTQGRFGVDEALVWRSVDDGDVAGRIELDASLFQHEWALAVREALQTRHLESYASEAGTSSDRLRRVLTGRVLLRVEDIAAAKGLLGVGMNGDQGAASRSAEAPIVAPAQAPADCVARGDFGVDVDLEWLPVHRGDARGRMDRDAAKIQHLWSVVVQDRLPLRDFDRYAVVAATTTERLRRVLDGEETMTIGDVAAAARLLNIEVEASASFRVRRPG